MSFPEKLIALMESLTDAQIRGLSPAQRTRLAALCRRAADIAEPPKLPSSGVLFHLSDGERSP